MTLPQGAAPHNCPSCATVTSTSRQRRSSPQTARQSPSGSLLALPTRGRSALVNLETRASSIANLYQSPIHTKVICSREIHRTPHKGDDYQVLQHTALL